MQLGDFLMARPSRLDLGGLKEKEEEENLLFTDLYLCLQCLFPQSESLQESREN